MKFHKTAKSLCRDLSMLCDTKDVIALIVLVPRKSSIGLEIVAFDTNANHTRLEQTKASAALNNFLSDPLNIKTPWCKAIGYSDVHPGKDLEKSFNLWFKLLKTRGEK